MSNEIILIPVLLFVFSLHLRIEYRLSRLETKVNFLLKGGENAGPKDNPQKRA